MEEQFLKIPKLASTSLFPRSSLSLGLMIERYNRDEPITVFDYPKPEKNSFVSLGYFLELQAAHQQLRKIKKELSRKGKRGWRRNRHFVKQQKALIRQIKANL